MKQAADVYTLDLIDKPRRGRPRKPDAKTDAQRAREYRARMKTLARVAVLFARADSFYKQCPETDVYDIERNALTYCDRCPVVAHPPCRAWGRLRQFAKPRTGEKELALWAVQQLRQNGGVLEHPAHSSLWAAAQLPRPGTVDEFGGWTLQIAQSWFGHRAEKMTWLYICGCPVEKIPALPKERLKATHVISRSKHRTKSDPNWMPQCTVAEREHTPPRLALWLLDLARRCRR